MLSITNIFVINLALCVIAAPIAAAGTLTARRAGKDKTVGANVQSRIESLRWRTYRWMFVRSNGMQED